MVLFPFLCKWSKEKMRLNNSENILHIKCNLAFLGLLEFNDVVEWICISGAVSIEDHLICQFLQELKVGHHIISVSTLLNVLR